MGWAVAIAFADEGADISIIYCENHKDAQDIKSASKSYSDEECVLFSLAQAFTPGLAT